MKKGKKEKNRIFKKTETRKVAPPPVDADELARKKYLGELDEGDAKLAATAPQH